MDLTQAKERVRSDIHNGNLVTELENHESQQEIQLFLEGVKPALLLRNKGQIVESLVTHFPSVSFPHRFGQVLIFQNGEDLKQFILNGTFIRVEKPILDYKTSELGSVLGYPPNACEVFKLNGLKENIAKSTGKDPIDMIELYPVDYHGIKFFTSLDHFEEDIEWLLAKRPVPTHLETVITIELDKPNGKRLVVKYEDFDLHYAKELEQSC
ncbi:hypothetical protein FOC89_02220 (plasmid) [Bacillus thuringiensis]|uniref:Uncharacterized protein n=1 Tax=Bacillus thuringiensis TaxID=1428 RepID=A0A0B5NJ37_BACTU|nr:hypothetical protein [Bacillus thuringiensis]OUB09497.1 hypothetical protein BK708_33840 [Bacillus thuringiensis serovar yunnanensis]AJG73971.1 hypothetical protein BF38_5727 [Bacillus thuringiensis]EEM74207.1 hypothetical protein bthur0010_58670 [Bacillus thuringiensis serovar pondicheriensis BGSC 4BA1]MEC2522137.1 hypothetical protein [Bacillus thuringiensis]OTX61134.1 hypothetical protein BK723_01190 [Bacillus thuringiensis serovar pondicheriensis]